MIIRPEFMRRCIELAARGSGMVAPNPLVGAVLVYNDRIIGEGWHRQYGQAHAEVNCLEQVAEGDRHLIPESTLYVSLEPCAHFGKTPPCAHRIVQEGIRKVVVGMGDPFALVNGKGIAILEEAGIEVVSGMLEQQCLWQNRRFITMHQQNRPYLHLKWAQTVNGFMAGVGMVRLKISGPLTDRLVHKWRSEEAAVMVGSQTARLDNPSLTNRLWSGPQPLRVVLDKELSLPGHLNLFTDGNPTLVLTVKESRQAGAVRWIQIDGLCAGEPERLLEHLFHSGIQSVLIEGGASVLNSFLKKDLWDEVHIITNTSLHISEGLKAPLLNDGIVFEEFYLGTDYIKGLKRG